MSVPEQPNEQSVKNLLLSKGIKRPRQSICRHWRKEHYRHLRDGTIALVRETLIYGTVKKGKVEGVIAG